MRAVVQRVARSSVTVDNRLIATIGEGLVVLAGFHRDDSRDDIEYIAHKVMQLRIFNDENNIMNKTIGDVDGELLLISQFTLYGDARKGRRPSYSHAMPPERAAPFFQEFVDFCKSTYGKVLSGVFGAHMEVDIRNTGPVTILLDSSKLF